MAAQSKLLPTGRSLKAIVADLTPRYLKHRTSISRRVYVTLFAALIHRVHNAVSEQKAAIRRQVEIREESGPRTAKDATDAEAQCDVRVETDHVERGMVLFIVVKAARTLGGPLNGIGVGVSFH